MKKRGFTLIELLAVIVILAVIALIAVPMILNVVEDARISAFKDSVYSAFNAVEYYLIDEDLGDVPESGIEVKFLNLKNNNFESGRMVKNVDGVLVAEFVSDGKYCATGSLTNLNISKGECEINAPGVEANVSGKEIAITITDDNGIVAYAITTSSEEPTEWINVEETTNIVENITAEAAGTYYVHVRNKYGKTTTKEYVVEQNAFCAYEIGQIWEFSYNGTNGSDGSPEEFIVPCDGTYQLEVYGAQGGCFTEFPTTRGKGGYSSGYKFLSSNTTLFVVVGGVGSSTPVTPALAYQQGGYNGGGGAYVSSSTYAGGGSGGGATHIALVSGTLSSIGKTLFDEKGLIVAGGGGGARSNSQKIVGIGGAGGGQTGGASSNLFGGAAIVNGATQTAGYAFGQGGSCATSGNRDKGAGGGGYYGGYAGNSEGSGGSGGSGWIDGVENGTTEAGVREGNGYAKITLVSINQ